MKVESVMERATCPVDEKVHTVTFKKIKVIFKSPKRVYLNQNCDHYKMSPLKQNKFYLKRVFHNNLEDNCVGRFNGTFYTHSHYILYST